MEGDLAVAHAHCDVDGPLDDVRRQGANAGDDGGLQDREGGSGQAEEQIDEPAVVHDTGQAHWCMVIVGVVDVQGGIRTVGLDHVVVVVNGGVKHGADREGRSSSRNSRDFPGAASTQGASRREDEGNLIAHVDEARAVGRTGESAGRVHGDSCDGAVTPIDQTANRTPVTPDGKPALHPHIVQQAVHFQPHPAGERALVAPAGEHQLLGDLDGPVMIAHREPHVFDLLPPGCRNISAFSREVAAPVPVDVDGFKPLTSLPGRGVVLEQLQLGRFVIHLITDRRSIIFLEQRIERCGIGRH